MTYFPTYSQVCGQPTGISILRDVGNLSKWGLAGVGEQILQIIMVPPDPGHLFSLLSPTIPTFIVGWFVLPSLNSLIKAGVNILVNRIYHLTRNLSILS